MKNNPTQEQLIEATQETPSNFVVCLWPEFRAFMSRLGIDIGNTRIKTLTIHMPVSECPNDKPQITLVINPQNKGPQKEEV